MKAEERNILFEMAEQLKLNSVAIRELLHIAVKHRPEVVAFLRVTYELNDTKMTRAFETLNKDK